MLQIGMMCSYRNVDYNRMIGTASNSLCKDVICNALWNAKARIFGVSEPVTCTSRFSWEWSSHRKRDTENWKVFCDKHQANFTAVEPLFTASSNNLAITLYQNIPHQFDDEHIQIHVARHDVPLVSRVRWSLIGLPEMRGPLLLAQTGGEVFLFPPKAVRRWRR